MRFDKYGRELDLIVLLTDNNRYTVRQLADKFDITPRTLYYYFDYLRSCGFRLIKSGATYRLDRSAAFFRRLHENISLSENEAAYICRLIDSAGKDSYTAASVRTKLARSFNLDDFTDPAVMRRANRNIEVLKEAMSAHKMVTLHGYSSPHSMTVSDRIVEPYLLMNENRDIRAYEIKTHTNKTFKISRMESVEVLDVPWIREDEHREMFTDFFMFSGEERHRVVLRLGQLSHNLLAEEYPASEACMTENGDGSWRLVTDVVSFRGIGRFVLGLYEDIEVEGDEGFRQYIFDEIGKFSRKASREASSHKPKDTTASVDGMGQNSGNKPSAGSLSPDGDNNAPDNGQSATEIK